MPPPTASTAGIGTMDCQGTRRGGGNQCMQASLQPPNPKPCGRGRHPGLFSAREAVQGSSLHLTTQTKSGAPSQLGDVPAISEILGARPTMKKPVPAQVDETLRKHRGRTESNPGSPLPRCGQSRQRHGSHLPSSRASLQFMGLSVPCRMGIPALRFLMVYATFLLQVNIQSVE